MRCPVCSNSTWKSKYKVLKQCTSCHFIQAQDKFFKIKPQEIYKQTYFNNSDYVSYEMEKPALEINFKRNINKIKKYQSKGLLLEIGCAYGYFLKLAKQHFSCEGIDLDKEITSLANKTSGVPIYTGDFISLPVKKNHYNVICMFDTIEHLKDPNSYVKKAFTSLKKGGIIVIETGDIESRLAKYQKEKWRMIKPPIHLQYFSKATLEILLENNGFKVLDSEYVSFYRTLGNTIYKLTPKLYTLPIFKQLSKIVYPLNTKDIMFVIAEKQ